MRHAVARSAVLAATVALAVACTGEAGVTIGPPPSTGPSTGPSTADAASPSGAAGTAATEEAAETGTGGKGAPATSTQRPASVGPGADIPASVMLEPTDFPAGRVVRDQTDVLALPPTEPAACQPRTAFPSDRYRYGARTREIDSDQPESGFVFETAVRYSAGRAGQAMTEMRRVLAACHSYPEPEAPSTIVSYRLERERFAGDDALLVLRSVRSPTSQPGSQYITVVRLGDVLLTTTSTGSEATASLGLALKLADVGARRGACLRSSC